MADFPTPPWQDLDYWQKRKKDRWRKVEAPAIAAPIVDTHCHLNSLSDPAYALARASLLGVEKLCTIVDPIEMLSAEGADKTFECLDSWEAKARLIAAQLQVIAWLKADVAVGESLGEDDYTYAIESLDVDLVSSSSEIEITDLCIGLGCHPHNASGFTEEVESFMRSKLKDSRVACIGEIGLDYHYDLSPRQVQRDVFSRQIRIAQELSMPIALHVREAHSEAFAILEKEGFPQAGVLLHCCSLPPQEIKPWVDAGCYIAYGGPITFNNADYARAGALEVPIDRLLTETDAPYMTPVPLRGIECQPDYVRFSALCLAELVSSNSALSIKDVLEAFRSNAHAFLNQGPFPCQRL